MKRSKSSRILKILSYVLLITGMIVILYPFYLTIITALKTPQESSQSFFSFPQSFYLGNFVNVLQKANYFVFFRNSAVVTLVSVFLIMVLIPMCSYAIARNMEKRYYKTMYFYLLAGIFVPFQVIMVPLVKYLAKLKLCNIPGLIIMCVTLASSQGVFLLVNYIRSVPRDLEEAAYIDGCGTVKAYVKIVLPMIKPILATIFVLNALWVWNDFQMPLLILNQSQDMWTCEGLLPLDGDVIIFVGIMDSDFRTESIEAFYVPKGTFVKLNPLIVHGTQYPVDKEDVHIVCMLPGRTFKNDMLSRRLETGEQIRITRGYKK